jgi:hypothetical protein
MKTKNPLPSSWCSLAFFEAPIYPKSSTLHLPPSTTRLRQLLEIHPTIATDPSTVTRNLSTVTRTHLATPCSVDVFPHLSWPSVFYGHPDHDPSPAMPTQSPPDIQAMLDNFLALKTLDRRKTYVYLPSHHSTTAHSTTAP